MKKLVQKIGVGIAGLSASGLALAQATPPDFTELSSAVSVETVVTAILAIAAVMVGVNLAWKGVQFIMKAVKGA